MLLNAVRPSYQNKVNLLGPEQTVANLWSVVVRDPINSFTDLVKFHAHIKHKGTAPFFPSFLNSYQIKVIFHTYCK